MQYLENNWALVTGASRGIGRQIACGLAERKCNVIVHARTDLHTAETLDLLSNYGIETFAISADLSLTSEIDDMIGRLKTGPAIDILYNNAAIQNKWDEIWDIDQDEWLRTLQINLFAMIRICNAIAPDMKKRGFGRIVNLTSGIRDVPQLSPYSVSKAAVDKYSMDLAAELRGTNVLVNRLDPGWLRTDMGGEHAQHEVETVLPGALVPALLEDNGPSGELFEAQNYRDFKG
ncbi:MAG: SDR family oxidoreductase [candidate division KSB1 bacterium]|nr:SDR family oxidoreductase [candidate division KSB1 bacterium]